MQRNFLNINLVKKLSYKLILCTSLMACLPIVPYNNEDNRSNPIGNKRSEDIIEQIGIQGRLPNAGSCQSSIGANIIGGQVARTGDLVTASTALLRIDSHICTATLVGPRHLITATHCFLGADSNSIIFAAFGVDLSNPIQVVEVASFVRHPNYSRQGVLNDIAVVTLAEDVNSSQQAVAIGSADEVRDSLPVIVAGYGSHYHGDSQSIRNLSWAETTIGEVLPDHSEFQLTIGQKRGVCHGDSGGPTFIFDKNTQCLKLIGATVGSGRGRKNCNEGHGTIMDVSKYTGWINCAFAQIGDSLAGLERDGSEYICSKNEVVQLR